MQEKIKTTLGVINVETFEKDGVNVITLTSLKNVCRQLGVEFGKYEFLETAPYPVCQTRVAYTDKNGVRMSFPGLGEANPETLNTDIARNFAYNTAKNRAMSDALLLLLGVSNKYTNEQIPDGLPMEEPELPEEISEEFESLIEDSLESEEMEIPKEEPKEEKPKRRGRPKKAEKKAEEEISNEEPIPEELPDEEPISDELPEDEPISDELPEDESFEEVEEEMEEETSNEEPSDTSLSLAPYEDDLEYVFKVGKVKGQSIKDALSSKEGKGFCDWVVANEKITGLLCEAKVHLMNIPEDIRNSFVA